jgi:serine/threonine protein kinase
MLHAGSPPGSLALADGLLPKHTVLRDRFVILRPIATTAFSNVYLAHDRRHERTVAIKQVLPQPREVRLARDALLGSFVREARLLHELRHRQLPQLHAAFHDQSGSYLVMEYVAGVTLERRLGEGGPARAPALAIAYALCRVVAFLHRQQPPVIHADIKPGNVLLATDGRVVLLDLGLARRRDAPLPPSPPIGTPEYAAPEQWRGEPLDERTDVYALGKVLRELLGAATGEPALDRVLRCATAAAPEDRFPTVSRLYAAIYDATESSRGLCRTTAARMRQQQPSRTTLWLALLLILLLSRPDMARRAAPITGLPAVVPVALLRPLPGLERGRDVAPLQRTLSSCGRSAAAMVDQASASRTSVSSSSAACGSGE